MSENYQKGTTMNVLHTLRSKAVVEMADQLLQEVAPRSGFFFPEDLREIPREERPELSLVLLGSHPNKPSKEDQDIAHHAARKGIHVAYYYGGSNPNGVGAKFLTELYEKFIEPPVYMERSEALAKEPTLILDREPFQGKAEISFFTRDGHVHTRVELPYRTVIRSSVHLMPSCPLLRWDLRGYTAQHPKLPSLRMWKEAVSSLIIVTSTIISGVEEGVKEVVLIKASDTPEEFKVVPDTDHATLQRNGYLAHYNILVTELRKSGVRFRAVTKK